MTKQCIEQVRYAHAVPPRPILGRNELLPLPPFPYSVVKVHQRSIYPIKFSMSQWLGSNLLAVIHLMNISIASDENDVVRVIIRRVVAHHINHIAKSDEW